MAYDPNTAILVLLGTFALAMAFAGNDLVNFVGVPLTGLDAYQDFVANGSGDPDTFLMGSLMGGAQKKTDALVKFRVATVCERDASEHGGPARDRRAGREVDLERPLSPALGVDRHAVRFAPQLRLGEFIGNIRLAMEQVEAVRGLGAVGHRLPIVVVDDLAERDGSLAQEHGDPFGERALQIPPRCLRTLERIGGQQCKHGQEQQDASHRHPPSSFRSQA